MVRKSARWTAAIALAGVMLSGCGAKPAATPVDGKQPDPGQKKNTIVVTMDSDIDDLDPHNFKSDAAQIVVDNTYDTFVDFASSADPTTGAIIANSEQVVSSIADMSISSDGKLVTFKVKPGIKFTNGNPVDGKAVATSMQRGIAGGGYAKIMWNLITANSPDQVKLVDASTVELTLEKGNRMTSKILPLALNVVMDPATTQAKATGDDQWASKFYKGNIVGTGPYTLSKWTPGVEYALTPAKDYWNKDKLKNDGVLVKVIPSAEQRFALLKQGAVDVALGVPPKDLASLKDDPNIKVYNFPSRNTNYLVMNNKVAPFDNPKVRQAVSYAIPTATLIEKVLYGYGRPLTSPVPEGMPTHDSSAFKYQTDVAKAKQLVKDAGAVGTKTQLAVSVSRTEDQQAAVWIQSALKEIGIEVEIQKLSDAQYREKQGKGELPLFIEYWYSWGNDPFYQLFWMFNSNNVGTNMAKYANPRVDQLITDGMYEQDAAKREAMSKEVQKIIIDEAPVAFLYQRDHIVAARKDVQGVNLWPDQHLRFFTLHK